MSAQSQPDAGSVLRDAAPAQSLSPQNKATLPQAAPANPAGSFSGDSTPILVSRIQITGASLFSAETLQARVADVASGTHTLGELQAAAERITALYRAKGYFLARAYLPAQKMTNGVVRIAVLEGRLSAVQMQNVSRLSDATVNARLATVQTGAVMHKAAVDRALLLLGDVPGVGAVDSRLAPGATTGDTVLVAAVKSAPAWGGKLDADNFGSLYSGRYRLGTLLEGNSALGFGERISASVLASDREMLSGRLGTQVPVGVDGLTFGAGVSHTQYSLGDTYKSLDAVGYSNALEANLRYPLLRSVAANLYAQGSIEQRKLRDEVRSTETRTDKEMTVGSLALQADWRDSLISLSADSQASLTLTHGKLDIVSADAAEIDAIAAKTSGEFSKFSASLSRQQTLWGPLSLALQARGQWAHKNLDSSERFSLGGANGVRAYPSGEASGDTGWLGSVEMRYALMPRLVASAFYDGGAIRVNARPYLSGRNDRSLSGAGVALTGAYASLDWRLMLAWRIDEASTAEPDKNPRFWAQTGWRF